MEDSQPSLSRQLRELHHVRNFTTTIPFDLIIVILSRLPAKSLLRFQSVSKLWFSTIRTKYFVDLFLTRSKTRPRLLLTLYHRDFQKQFIFSAPEHTDDDKSSSSVMARYHMMIGRYDALCGSVNGFVCFTSVVFSKPVYNEISVYNPTTRQIINLPDLIPYNGLVDAFLGYDPVEDQYKVLCVIMFHGQSQQQEEEHLVCTVSSSQKQEWRKIESPNNYNHNICGWGGTCIDGALYYGVDQSRLVRFNVRSEKIEFIETPQEAPGSIVCHSGLMNYNGKLGCLNYFANNLMTLWVLENVEKQEWSSMTYDLPNRVAPTVGVGTVTEGVIHFGVSMAFRLPFRVCYYDYNNKNTREVEIQGMEEDGVLTRIRGRGSGRLTGNPGHIENIRFL